MGKLTPQVFNESCCDGGGESINSNSARTCGCDPGAGWTCQVHTDLTQTTYRPLGALGNSLTYEFKTGPDGLLWGTPKVSRWDRRFLDLASLVSSWSKDPSTKTGAVIVGPDKAVISVGFNGFPKGMPDNEELYANRDEKYSRVVHCEVNALLFAGRAIPPDSTLYTVPFMSCDRCVVQMLQAGIKRFIAPKATGERAERWAEAFERTRKYITECGGILIEVDKP